MAIVKVEGADKDSDGFINIKSNIISWNGDDDGSGNFKIYVSNELIGPNGNTLSTVEEIKAITIYIPPPCEKGCPGS